MVSSRSVIVPCVLALTAFAALAIHAGATSAYSLNNPPQQMRLQHEAQSYVAENLKMVERSIANMCDAFTQRGELILSPVGDPPVFPTGSIRKKVAPTQPLRIGSEARMEVTADVMINQKTTHRFAIQLVSATRQVERKGFSSGAWTMRIARLGDNGITNLTSGLRLTEQGRYETLYILVAYPLKGGQPSILDVDHSSFTVPNP